MTDQECEEILKKMEEFFKSPLPDPIREPIRFAYYVKLFKYYVK